MLKQVSYSQVKDVPIAKAAELHHFPDTICPGSLYAKCCQSKGINGKAAIRRDEAVENKTWEDFRNENCFSGR